MVFPFSMFNIAHSWAGFKSQTHVNCIVIVKAVCLLPSHSLIRRSPEYPLRNKAKPLLYVLRALKVRFETGIFLGIAAAVDCMAVIVNAGKRKRYSTGRYAALESQMDSLEKERERKGIQYDLFSGFLVGLGETGELPVDINEKLFHRLVNYATVYPDGRVVFTFRNGVEVSTEI